MHQTTRRWVAGLALLIFAVAGAPALAQNQIEVSIERIDTAKYPELDIYFRVLDTNPTTAFKPLVRADVRLAEGPRGGPLAAATIVSDNFARPDLRPLAAAVVLDRSGSVDDVIRFIRAAISSFVALMKTGRENTYRPTDPTRELADATYTLAFAGDHTISNQALFPYSENVGAIRAWIEANLVRGSGFSPVWGALERGVAATAQQPYDLPDGSRIAFLISDGLNNRGYPDNANDRRVSRAIGGAQGARIRVYTLGMSFVNNQGVVVGDVNRPEMQQIAAQTGGVYFEPRSPFPPPVPRAPAPPDTNVDAVVPPDVAREFLRLSFGTAAGLAKDQAKTGPLGTQLDAAVREAMTPPTGSTTGTAVPASYEDFIRIWNPPPNPGPPLNVTQITYRDLQGVEASNVDLAANAVTATDLEQKDYYEDQIRNILTKIQTSEKTIYRVTHRVTDETFDGSLRQVALTVQYDSTVAGVVQPLAPGTATATYRAPAIVDEDKPDTATFPIDLTIPQAGMIFRPTDPRGNAWPTPEPTLRMSTRLITEVPSNDGTPSTRVLVATLINGTFKLVEPPADLPNIDRVRRHIAGESADYEPLLRSLAASAQVVGSGVTVTLAPKTPTAVPNREAPTRRPGANVAEPDQPRLLSYDVLADLERPYSFNTGSGPINTMARYALPGMSFYVKDRTPPTLGIYLTPVSRGVNMIAVRPVRADQETPEIKVALSGDDLGVPAPNVRTLVNGFAAEPYQLDGGGTVPGFLVPENVEVRVQVLAKDNFDRNRNHAYLLEDPQPVPLTDAYTMATRSEPGALSQAAPYFSPIRFEDVGQPKAEAFHGGLSFKFEQAGQSDSLPDRKIFRAANVEVTGPGTFRIMSGQDIYLTVKASDVTGNTQEIRVPVLVTPVGVNIDKLMAERERK